MNQQRDDGMVEVRRLEFQIQLHEQKEAQLSTSIEVAATQADTRYKQLQEQHAHNIATFKEGIAGLERRHEELQRKHDDLYQKLQDMHGSATNHVADKSRLQSQLDVSEAQGRALSQVCSYGSWLSCGSVDLLRAYAAANKSMCSDMFLPTCVMHVH